jgi:hypothetical protein
VVFSDVFTAQTQGNASQKRRRKRSNQSTYMVNIMTTFNLTPREVVDAALNATKSAGKIQTVIRVYLDERQNSPTECWPNDELAGAVATICTEYRIEIQEWIDDAPNTPTDNAKQRKKAVLNQMNNVSKICKEVLGHRIVAVKGTLEYVAEEYEQPTKSEESDSEPPAPSAPDTAETISEFARQLADVTCVKDAIARMMDIYGDDFVGQETVDLLKARKAEAKANDAVPF